MVRSGESSTRVHYKGSSNDFVIFAESPEAVTKWRKDRSVPLVEVVNSFHIFTTQGGGAQGSLNAASQADLENNFGTNDENEIVRKILEQGDIKDMKSRERGGNTNQSRGSLAAH